MPPANSTLPGRGSVKVDCYIQSYDVEKSWTAMGVTTRARNVQLDGDIAARHHATGTSEGEGEKRYRRINRISRSVS